MADTVGHRESLYYIMTGEPFSGPKAAQMGLVNKSVPLAELRGEVTALAQKLLEKNPVVLRYAKNGFKRCRELDWDQNEDYLYAKLDQCIGRDPEQGRKEGMKQFLDDKTLKPGLQSYKR
jgi:trans-feruloyl-CoA hydratase/vanillin synthase